MTQKALLSGSPIELSLAVLTPAASIAARENAQGVGSSQSSLIRLGAPVFGYTLVFSASMFSVLSACQVIARLLRDYRGAMDKKVFRPTSVYDFLICETAKTPGLTFTR